MGMPLLGWLQLAEKRQLGRCEIEVYLAGFHNLGRRPKSQFKLLNAIGQARFIFHGVFRLCRFVRWQGFPCKSGLYHVPES